MNAEELQKEFEEFVQKQATSSISIMMEQLESTPYKYDGKLAAAFYMCRHFYQLGRQENPQATV